MKRISNRKLASRILGVGSKVKWTMSSMRVKRKRKTMELLERLNSSDSNLQSQSQVAS